MSRFWERILRVTPAFKGSPEEEKQNVESHTWRTVDLEQRYGLAGLSKIIECNVCKIVAGSERSKYPCGEAPPMVSYEEAHKKN